MKKILYVIFMIFILCGCNNNDSISDEKMQKYNEYKTVLVNNGSNVSYDIPFSYALNIEKVKDGYSYTLVINEPLMVMNNIQVMALNNTDSNSDMTLNCGIIDDEVINMIPNQKDESKGYPSGIALNGISETGDFTLYCLVNYYNEDNTASSRKFFSFIIENGKIVGENNE